jgi:hypothetical protein
VSTFSQCCAVKFGVSMDVFHEVNLVFFSETCNGLSLNRVLMHLVGVVIVRKMT